jgi:hypothetical protein
MVSNTPGREVNGILQNAGEDTILKVIVVSCKKQERNMFPSFKMWSTETTFICDCASPSDDGQQQKRVLTRHGLVGRGPVY